MRRGHFAWMSAFLLLVGTGAVAGQAPPAWLAATGGVVAARVRRLADPPVRARWLGHGLALTALTLAIASVSALVPLLAAGG